MNKFICCSKLKLILVTLLSITLLISTPLGVFADSPEGMTITVGNITTEGGASVDVPISISGNPGICGATLSISYQEGLTLTKITRGEALADLDMTKPGKLTTNPFKILWAGTEEDSSNGTIAVLTFSVPNTSGEYPVRVSFQNGDIVDGDYISVSANAANGGITVKDADQEAASAVNEALSDLDPDNADSVAAAREAYDALSEDQKALVDPELLQKLTDAEAALEKKAADQRAIDEVVRAINAMNPGDKSTVESARALYDALDPELQQQIAPEVLERLTNAERVIREEEEQAEADQSAADAVVDVINSMDPEDKESVQAALAAYNSLTDAQKALVDQDALSKLEAADQAIKDKEDAAEVNQIAADTVVEMINSMDPSDWNSVDAVKRAYDALTEDQKALVTNYSDLESAVQAADAGRVDLNSLEYEEIEDFEWDGYPYSPAIYCVFLKTTDPWHLYEDEDYTVTYENNTDVGTGKAILKGIGKYKGTKELTFRIIPINMTGYESSFRLSKTTYTYDGKTKSPALLEKEDSEFYTWAPKKGDYTISCTTNRKSVGTHKIKYVFKGNYKGYLSFNIKINPKGTSLKKLTAGKKSFTVKWKKQASQTTGYQIQYGLKKNFKGAKTYTVKKNKTVKAKIKKLKGKKKYYVRIRTYKTVKGKKYYSSWSKAKTVKTRK